MARLRQVGSRDHAVVARAGHDNVKAIFFGPLRAQGKRRGQGRQCRRLHEFAPAHFAHETLPSKQAGFHFSLKPGLANKNRDKYAVAPTAKATSLVRESLPPNRLGTPPLARHPPRDGRSKALSSSSAAPQACLGGPPLARKSLRRRGLRLVAR